MNKKDIIKLIITGVLVLILILLVMNSRHAVKNAQMLRRKTLEATELTLIQQKGSDHLGVSPDSQVSGRVRMLNYKILEEESLSLKPTRDPFSNLPTSIKNEASSGALSLTGVLWDKDKPLAIINGEIVNKGARIGNKTIIEIKKDSVILSDGQIISEVNLE